MGGGRMRFFEELEHVIAHMSEHSDGPMGSSTNHGENGVFAARRAWYLQERGISPDNTAMLGLVHETTVQTINAVPPERRLKNTDGAVSLRPALAFGVQDCFPC